MSESEPKIAVCLCCLCEEKIAQYQLSTDLDTEWQHTVYCYECMDQIRLNTWSIAKDNLLGVDCLAEFRNIQQNGLLSNLVEHDVLGNKKVTRATPIKNLKYGDQIQTPDIGADLTDLQRDQLVQELKGLDSKDVTPDDIRIIAKKYWTDIKPDLDMA
jgi:hypothetical protein